MDNLNGKIWSLEIICGNENENIIKTPQQRNKLKIGSKKIEEKTLKILLSPDQYNYHLNQDKIIRKWREKKNYKKIEIQFR